MAAGEVARLMVTVGADVRAMQQGLSSATQSIQNLNRTATTLLGVGGLVTTVGIVGQAIDKALDFSAAGSSLLNLENSFHAFAQSAGRDGATVLAELQSMSGGMMTQSALMQQYNRAFMLAGADIANSMPQLVQLARASAATGMGDFEYMLQSIVTGLGRLSPLILDNLGYTISLEAAYSKYAATLGIAASSLTKGQQQQAVLNEMMDQAAVKFGDLDEAAGALAGGGVAQLRTAWADLADEIKQNVAPAIDGLAGRLAGGLSMNIPGTTANRERLLEWFGTLTDIDSTTSAYDRLGKSAEAVAEAIRFIIVPGGPGLDVVTGEISDLVRYLDIGSMSTEQFLYWQRQLSRYAPEAAQAMGEQRAAMLHANNEQAAMIVTGQRLMGVTQGIAAASNAAAGSTDTFASALEGLADTANGIIAGLGDVRMALIGYQKALAGTDQPWRSEYGSGTAGMLAYGAAMIEWAADQYTSATQDIAAAHQTMASSGASGWNDLQSAMESYYSSWQSLAATAISPTQSFDLAALQDQMGMHVDTWDENARRAMDVVNRGLESPWASQMGLSSPEQALQYVQDFYAGRLGAEQYNLDAAVEQVRQQVETQAGQANLQAMLEQALMGAGLGPGNSLVAQALGDPLGIAGTDGANLFGDNFTSAMAAVDFRSPAEDAAAQVLAGWTAGMQSPSDTTLKSLFGLLWPLIEPKVYAMLNPPT